MSTHARPAAQPTTPASIPRLSHVLPSRKLGRWLTACPRGHVAVLARRIGLLRSRSVVPLRAL